MRVSEPIKSRFSSKLHTSQANFDQSQLLEFKNNLSQASKQDSHLAKYAPKIDTIENPDILLVAFDSCIANLVNANDDAIDSQSMLALSKTCNHKFINFEHDRSYIVGHTLNFGFHSFSDKSEIDYDSIVGYKDPFIMSLGGVIWKMADPYLVENISNQNSSSLSMSYTIHASWEVAFSEYVLAVGSKKISDAKIITDDTEVLSLEKYLKINGGNGYLPDGAPVYRVITDPSPLFLGIGLTYNPAASVDKVESFASLTSTIEEANSVTKEDFSNFKQDIIDSLNDTKSIFLNNFSQKQKNNVKADSMKITSIEDITDDTLKEATASVVRDFIKTELLKKDDEISKATKAKEDSKLEAEGEVQNLKTKLDESQAKTSNLENEILTLQGQLQAIKDEQDRILKEQVFSSRMASLSSEYNLEDERVRNIVASKVKALDTDEDFSAWKTEFEVFGFGLKKEAKASSADAAGDILKQAKAKNAGAPIGAQSNTDNTKFNSTVKIEQTSRGILI